jgi:hypothetical protein
MSRWQDEESSSSSASSSSSSQEDFVIPGSDDEKDDSYSQSIDEEQPRPDPYVTQRKASAIIGKSSVVSFAAIRKDSQQHSSAGGNSQNDIPVVDGTPCRWIQDRTEGRVHGSDGALAPRPPCFLCWPPPLLRTCPAILETNSLCTIIGRCGFCNGSTANNRRDYYSGFGNRGRCAIMTYALVLDLAGLLMTVFAALALSDGNADLIQVAAFSTTSLQPVVLDATLNRQQTIPATSLHLGLQALLIRDEVTVTYEDFCTTPGMEQFLPPENCNACNDTTLYVVIGMLVTMVAYIPSLGIDCLRMYKDYDVNCQKTASLLWSLVSLAGYGLTYYYHRYQCLASFYEGPVLYDINGAVVTAGLDSTDGVVLTDFVWDIGVGQICLLAGFVLKAIDFFCHLFVATPTITRDREEQWAYERLSKEAELDMVKDKGGEDHSSAS